MAATISYSCDACGTSLTWDERREAIELKLRVGDTTFPGLLGEAILCNWDCFDAYLATVRAPLVA